MHIVTYYMLKLQLMCNNIMHRWGGQALYNLSLSLGDHAIYYFVIMLFLCIISPFVADANCQIVEELFNIEGHSSSQALA